MNNEHVSFDELVEFACYDKYDENYKKMAVRVNSHLFQCKECLRVYNAVYATKKALDGYVGKQNMQAKVKFHAISALLKTQKKLGLIGNSIESLFDSFDVSFQKMKLYIPNLERIEVTNNSLGLNFCHPNSVLYAKSYGNDITKETIDSVLIDGDNKVKIDLDGTVSIELNENECPEGTVLFLLPLEDGINSYVSVSQKKDNGLVLVMFEDVEPGNYQLISNIGTEQ